MRFARAGRAAAAFILLASGGCDYWDNLVDVNTLTKADLEVKVVDVWTGEPLPGASCRDSLRSISDTADDQGVIRVIAGATGQYAFTCSHEWYFDGQANVHLTKAGAHAVAKLARRGLADWYPEPSLKVGIPLPRGSAVRFPLDLNWQATPWDTTGRFRYEWTFLHTERLNHGHWVDHIQLDPESYSPRFRSRASTETGVQAGADTVILKVYSLMAMGQGGGYLVGIDTVPFEWIRNLKPKVHIDFTGGGFQVGCPGKEYPIHLGVTWSDSDGGCVSIRFGTKNAPSLPKMDTLLSCEQTTNRLVYALLRPKQPGRAKPNQSEEYDNTVFAEVTDDNGETARDSLTFLTRTNAPPVAFAQPINPKGDYLWPGEPIPFEIKGADDDGGILGLRLFWIRASDGHRDSAAWTAPNPKEPNSADSQRVVQTFTTPGVYRLEGRAYDDCGDTGIYVLQSGITIEKDTPPTVGIGDLTAEPQGDSLLVRFKLMVTDPDALTEGKDSISSVSVTWGAFGTETNSDHVQSIAGKPYSRLFPALRSGTSLAIRVQANDLHSGTGTVDTLVRIP